MPDYIDDESGYRYYKESSVDKASVISMFRSMEFSIEEIKDILKNYSDDIEIIEFLEFQKARIEKKVLKYNEINSQIDTMIHKIQSNNIKDINSYSIEEKSIDEIIFAGFRFKGSYSDTGKGLKIVSASAGKLIAGSAMSLYYDSEYREKDADIETGFPVSRNVYAKDINCRILKGGRAVSLIHKGSYDTFSRSYEKIFNFINERKYKVISPTREIYMKGPGIFFRGNPEKYLSEIRILIEI